jgi:hypothetical protein
MKLGERRWKRGFDGEDMDEERLAAEAYFI